MPSIIYKTVKAQREEKQKTMISGQLFSFLNFKISGNFVRFSRFQ